MSFLSPIPLPALCVSVNPPFIHFPGCFLQHITRLSPLPLASFISTTEAIMFHMVELKKQLKKLALKSKKKTTTKNRHTDFHTYTHTKKKLLGSVRDRELLTGTKQMLIWCHLFHNKPLVSLFKLIISGH